MLKVEQLTGVPKDYTIDFGVSYTMRYLPDGILDPARVNPANASM